MIQSPRSFAFLLLSAASLPTFASHAPAPEEVEVIGQQSVFENTDYSSVRVVLDKSDFEQMSMRTIEDSIAYAKQRVQFGRPIGDFQAIRFKIATMAAEIEAARQLTYFVAEELDSRRRCDKEAGMAKWFASEMAERVTSEALQIHGGYGYTTDLPIERYWRDARLTKIFEGTSEIQLRIISDRLLED